MRVDAHACPLRLLEQLLQIEQVVSRDDDERPGLDVRADARGNRVAETPGVRAVENRHALQVHAAELHDKREPLLHRVLLRHGAQALIKPRRDALVPFAEPQSVVRVSRHALQPEQKRRTQGNDVRLPLPEREVRRVRPAEGAALRRGALREGVDGAVVEVDVRERGEKPVDQQTVALLRAA